jgi:hypothetical protein
VDEGRACSSATEQPFTSNATVAATVEGVFALEIRHWLEELFGLVDSPLRHRIAPLTFCFVFFFGFFFVV